MKLAITLAAVGVLACGVSPAYAQGNQPRDSRPDRGLFGNTKTGAEQSLTAAGQAGMGYDDDTLPGQNDTPVPNVAAPYSQLAGSLHYALRKGRANIQASGGASVSHYASLDGANAASYYSDFGGTFRIARKTTLNGSQRFTYQPLYSLVRTPAISPDAALDPLSPDLGATVIEQPAGSTWPPYLYSDSNVNLSQALTSRVSVYGGVTHSQTIAGDATPGYRSGMLMGGFNWRISKDLTAYFGYGYGNAHYASRDGREETSYRRQNINAGINYNKALSVSRRTKLSFWTGSTAISDSVTVGGSTHFFFLGGANLSREVGRTWGATLSYNHNVDFQETFRSPIQYDSLVASYGGLINRRLRFNSFVGASFGAVGFSGANSGYYNYYAGATLEYGLTEMFGISGSYSYYQYHYEKGVQLPEGYPSVFDRNSVRAQFVVQVPIFQRRGKQNATR